jgi:hypothetical protein
MTPYTVTVETNISEEPAASIFTVKNEAMWEKCSVTQTHEDKD